MLENIIFDVGDVLLEYRWRDMLLDHGLTPEAAERVGMEMFGNDLWNVQLDRGLMSQEDVITAYAELYPEDKEEIAWFLSHGEYMHVPRPAVWDRVARLKAQGYGIYLLSNYSEDLFKKHTKDADFIQYIDGGVVSYQVHMAKPDPQIYRCLLEKFNLQPQTCLFYDDRAENVEAARAQGIEAVQVTSQAMLIEALDGLLHKGKATCRG